ncbi:MAG: divalent cation transporter [Luteolibacter sp.]
MNELSKILISTTLAGAAIPLGGLLASKESIHPRWLENEFRHGVIAMGGGILIAAVALVLVPESLAHLPIWGILLCFLLGGAAFGGLGVFLAKSKTPSSNLVAMLADFIPEAIAMGAAFAAGGSAGMALAVFMFLQNLPEGFNAFREMRCAGHFSAGRLLVTFAALVPLGPIAGLAGYYLLADSPEVIDGLLLFAAGGILYVVFQDIAPQAKLRKHWLPSLGAVLGFALGLLGYLLIE